MSEYTLYSVAPVTVKHACTVPGLCKIKVAQCKSVINNVILYIIMCVPVVACQNDS